MNLPPLNESNAPEGSRATLTATAQVYGFVPNIYGVLAHSPLAVEAYLTLAKLIPAKSALSPIEQQALMLAISQANGCTYCVAAHAFVAAKNKAEPADIAALRRGESPTSPRIASLARFVRAVIAHRGWVPAEERSAFEAAGFGSRETLDVLTIVALKTLSNYANHLAQPPIDAVFQPTA